MVYSFSANIVVALLVSSKLSTYSTTMGATDDGGGASVVCTSTSTSYCLEV